MYPLYVHIWTFTYIYIVRILKVSGGWSATQGTRKRNIHCLINVKDRDILGKMDPYVKIRVGETVKRSRTAKNGGKNPQWGERIDL